MAVNSGFSMSSGSCFHLSAASAWFDFQFTAKMESVDAIWLNGMGTGTDICTENSSVISAEKSPVK